MNAGLESEDASDGGRIDDVLQSLFLATKASRVTLRRNRSGTLLFPVTHEVLEPGAASLMMEDGPEFREQPVVRALARGEQVIHRDTALLSDDPELQQLLSEYGHVRAQIVTPILADQRLVAVVSVHELDRPRAWTPSEAACCRAAAEQIGKVL
jgi:GAF domain-containing protein